MSRLTRFDVQEIKTLVRASIRAYLGAEKEGLASKDELEHYKIRAEYLAILIEKLDEIQPPWDD